MGFFTERTLKLLSEDTDKDRLAFFDYIIKHTEFVNNNSAFIKRSKSEQNEEWDWIHKTEESFFNFMEENGISRNKWDFRMTPAGMINSSIRDFKEDIYESLQKAFGYIVLKSNKSVEEVLEIGNKFAEWTNNRREKDLDKAALFEIKKKCYHHNTVEKLENEYQAQIEYNREFNKNHSIKLDDYPITPEIIDIYYRDGIKLCRTHTKEQFEWVLQKATEYDTIFIFAIVYKNKNEELYDTGAIYPNNVVKIDNKSIKTIYGKEVLSSIQN